MDPFELIQQVQSTLNNISTKTKIPLSTVYYLTGLFIQSFNIIIYYKLIKTGFTNPESFIRRIYLILSSLLITIFVLSFKITLIFVSLPLFYYLVHLVASEIILGRHKQDKAKKEVVYIKFLKYFSHFCLWSSLLILIHCAHSYPHDNPKEIHYSWVLSGSIQKISTFWFSYYDGLLKDEELSAKYRVVLD